MTNTTEGAADAEYARAKTSVWWDIENCPVPKGWDAHGIAQKLNSALMHMNYCGPLSISSYGNTDLIPKSVQQALSSTGVSLNHVPSGRKDASDKKILVDMFLWVVENPPPANLMLISGDGDFSDALHRLRMKRYNILLAHPQQASPSLVASAKTSWLWRSLLASGCPPTLCHSSRLLDSGSCSFDSEISSQDVSVSEHVLSTQPMDSGSCSSKAARNKLKGINVPKAPNQLLQETKRKKLQKKCSETGESEWFCKVCNVACKSIEIFSTHLSGKEHAAQWELKQNLELLGEPENIAATSSECHEQDVVEITNKVVEARVEVSAHCGSPSLVKKQAEALGDVKLIEDILQDNDLQSREAQESMKFLEKRNKELMEPITISERSGREFLPDFKERLDRDGVAPLNVDHVFSELRRDFRVPKEVRECFDTIFKKLEPTQNEIEIEKLKGMLKQGLEIESGDPENAPAGPSENLEEDMNKKKKRRRKKKSTLIEDKAEPYVCSICSVICDSPAVFESHLKGRKHAATIKKHAEALLDDQQIQEEIIQDNGHPKDMTEELRSKPVEAPENIDYLDKQRQELRERCATSERSVEEFFQTFEEVLENDYKSLPNAECIFTDLNPEFSAPKEAREWIDAIFKEPELSQDANLTWEFESTPNQNLGMNSGDPESSPAGATEHAEEYMDMKKKDKVTKDKAEPEAYVCSICSVICVCPIVFESHLMGRRHAARVKKHAEVLFDDKKILEESLKEKDHSRDALEELQFEPKDAQVSIKEVSQSTKERVGNENEQIPSVEFPEPKKARQLLDSIVKRLEISLEDTSKQTLVEAENASERVEEVAETRKENGAAATQIRFCDWCNVMCSSQMDFDSHLAGKRHAATLKKRVLVPVVKKQARAKFAYVRKNGHY